MRGRDLGTRFRMTHYLATRSFIAFQSIRYDERRGHRH
jgi:hypothetical protein